MYISRSNQEKIFHSFEGAFTTAVLGPRRVGKSTLVNYFAKQHAERSWVFLNMDSLQERLRVEAGQLKEIIQENIRRRLEDGGKVWVCIDEAQKCPAIFDQIKLLYDQYKEKNILKFILTGSGFLELHQLSAESLAGRIELFYLRDFNLHESALLTHEITLSSKSIFDGIDHYDNTKIKKHIHSVSPLKPLLEKSLTEQLLWGGLPEVYASSDLNARRNYLNNYLQTYLEKDIRSIDTIADINLYHKMMEIIAEQTGSVRHDQRILETLHCSRDTLKKYRGFLLATLVYKEIYPFIGSSLKRLVKSPKGYLKNNGLISALTGLDDLTVLKKSGLIGHRFENWFLKEIEIWLDREVKRSEIYYWRTSSGIEVDFVVEKKPDVYPFEVTYSHQIQDKKVKNLEHFLKNEPRAKMGFYIYSGDFHYDHHSRICFIPAWAIS